MVRENRPVDWRPFEYDLPAARIAQRPVHPPESAKMLISEGKGRISDATYSELGGVLSSGDLLIFNQTKVVAARVFASLVGSKSGRVEFLLIKRLAADRWQCLAKPLKKLLPGTEIDCGEGLYAEILARVAEKEIEVSFRSSSPNESVDQLLLRVGTMPIPPYIRGGHADLQDRKDYQSIFAKEPGSVAAPTASLHFSHSLMNDLGSRGIENVGLTLHLGTASFLPVYDGEENSVLRSPGREYYIHSTSLLAKISTIRESGRRVIAVGTSVVRALESMARCPADDGELCESSLFITPGFKFQMLDAIVTNFHQPGTTHLLLVESFVGRQRLQEIYEHALRGDYRFLSYGDGMLLW